MRWRLRSKTPMESSWCPHSSAWALPTGTRMPTGLLIGLRRGTKPGHIARAAEESIAFQVADVIEAMDADTKCPFQRIARRWRRGRG